MPKRLSNTDRLQMCIPNTDLPTTDNRQPLPNDRLPTADRRWRWLGAWTASANAYGARDQGSSPLLSTRQSQMLDRSGFPSIVVPNRASSSAHAVSCGSFCRNADQHDGIIARKAPTTHNGRDRLLDRARARAPFLEPVQDSDETFVEPRHMGQSVIHPIALCRITYLSYATERVEDDSELVPLKGLACLSKIVSVR
jgi:hypothetical protein